MTWDAKDGGVGIDDGIKKDPGSNLGSNLEATIVSMSSICDNAISKLEIKEEETTSPISLSSTTSKTYKRRCRPESSRDHGSLPSTENVVESEMAGLVHPRPAMSRTLSSEIRTSVSLSDRNSILPKNETTPINLPDKVLSLPDRLLSLPDPVEDSAVVLDDDDDDEICSSTFTIDLKTLLNGVATDEQAAAMMTFVPNSHEKMTTMKSITKTTKVENNSMIVLDDDDDEPEIVFIENSTPKRNMASQPRRTKTLLSRRGKSSLTASSEFPRVASLMSGARRIAARPPLLSEFSLSASSSDPSTTGFSSPTTVSTYSSITRLTSSNTGLNTPSSSSSSLSTASWGQKKRKKRSKLIIDTNLNIDALDYKHQLSDPSDLISRPPMAPFSRRAMHLLEFGGVERLFSLPSWVANSSPGIAKPFALFIENLVTHSMVDESGEEP